MKKHQQYTKITKTVHGQKLAPPDTITSYI